MARALVTRPLDEAPATAAALADRGHEAIIAPVTRIEATGADIPGSAFAGIIATSARAFACLAQRAELHLRNVPVHCVGARTAAAARARGFVVESPGADARSLLDAWRRLPEAGPILYLAGRDRKPFIEDELARRGVHIVVAEIYAAVAAGSLPDSARAALADGRCDAALAYSRRSAEILLRLAREAGLVERLLAIPHICMSADVAAPLRAAGAQAIVAAAPVQQAMLDAFDVAMARD